MATVLYLAGWGRSGTTILGRILGAYPGACNVGEVFHLWYRGLVRGRWCGCGVPVRDCPLWQKVLKEGFADELPDPRQVLKWQQTSARARRAGALLAGDHPLAEITGRLYQAIATVTGAKLIIDSSKTPAGAALLASRPEIPSYLLHMVRDPRAVAYSWQRPKLNRDTPEPVPMKSHGTLESGRMWMTWNLLSARVARAYGDRYDRLRYEDFIADPRGSVERLLGRLDLPVSPGPFVSSHAVNLDEDHTVSGNPGRFDSGTVEISPDDAWKQALPARDRRLTTAVTAPLMLRYGYPLRVRTG